jgi:hypothetical protein
MMPSAERSNDRGGLMTNMPELESHERRRGDHDGSVIPRLERIERKVDDLVRCQDEQAKAIRTLEDWRIEMNVYLRQARWTLIVALGALIAGSVNIALALAAH